jgi:hypothetical protein
MKITLLSTITVLLCTTLFTSCKRLEPGAPGDSPGLQRRLAANGGIPQSCPGCTDYSTEDFKGLSVSAAAKLSNLYSANHYPNYLINGSASDSRSVWFSLDSIKKFIFKIEQAMCKCDVRSGLGIRIQFGEYPSPSSMTGDPDFSTLNPQMGSRHTLFMIPTYNYNNVDYDFDPWHLGGSCTKPTTICEWFNGPDSSFFKSSQMLALSPDDSQGSKNHGNLCPPLCQAGSSCFPLILPVGSH